MASSTPFFKAFGPLLFGRKTGSKLKAIREIESLGEIYEIFGDLVPEKLLGAAPRGANSRDRCLPPRVTFWAFVWQVMQPQSSCREVVRKIEAWWRWAQKERGGQSALSASAYCQARARLETETLELILAHTAHNLERHVLTEEKGPAGRRVRIVDGTGISMPDTPENQERWPQSGEQKPGLGFPVAKLVGIFSLASGAMIEHEVGALREHDSRFLSRLMDRMQKGDILLGDRAFCSYATLHSLRQRKADGLMRLHQARSADMRQGKPLGKLDRLVEWKRPAKKPEGCDEETFNSLPETLTVRLIGLKIEVPGFRTRSMTLVTTLTDPALYPADELRELFAKRWNVELHFHQIKIALGMDVLRCKSPDLIEKEILIHLIAYNLIRLFMQRAAHIHHVNLQRLSFKGTLDASRHFAGAIHAAMGSQGKQDLLIRQMLAVIAGDPVPLRPGRSEPRAKKRRPKNYHILNKPRSQMGNLPHKNRAPKNRPKPALS